jgi:amino acid adenylation domain-containing protein
MPGADAGVRGASVPRRVLPPRARTVFAASETEQSVGRRFEGVVRAHPDRVAVRAPGQQWTYEKLNATANRIARGLNTFPDPARPVALWLPAGPTLFAAMLATLKAGRFYVPLDPTLGLGRLRAILGEADAAAILTDGGGVADATGLSGDRNRVVRVEEIADEGPADDLSVAVSPDDLAYVLFTSGSTGRPKGVMQSHRNLLHNVLKLSNGLGIVPDDRLTLLSSCSFGASVSDIYGALLNGAAVCPYTMSAGGLPGLRRVLMEEGITILHCVPSLFRQLANALDGSEAVPHLRLIKLGGEPVLSSDFDLYRKRFPRHCLFHVGLGSTEVNVIRQWFADHDSVCTTSFAPLGYAVDGTEVMLLDPSGRPTTADTGEIAVVSRTLPPGYWKRPDLTAKAFEPVPDRRGQRMFRTGDVGRLLPDGCLLYVGRRDSRLKIRGHWVELAEVEGVLNSLPGIHEAVVVTREGPPGTRLIAYVVAPTRRRPTLRTMRQAISKQLGEWMVPNSFLFLGTLPRTPNGKIDRKALPESGGSRPELEGRFVEPRNSVESKIARIWCEILGLEEVGIYDDFFDLGGDSLLVVQLALEMEKQLRTPVPLASILQAPRVAELDEIFGQRRRSKGPLPSLVAIQPKGTRPPFFCVHPVGGIPFYRELASVLGPDQPFYGLQSQGFDRKRRPYDTVEEMAAHYVREILELQAEGPYYLGGHSLGGTIAFEMARQLRSQGQKTALLALFDTPNFRLPLPLPTTSPEFVRRRARIHLEVLREIGAREKVSYLLSRVRTLLLLAVRPLALGYEALFHPERRVQRKVLDANRRAGRIYSPSFYGGRVTLFRATHRLDERPRERWLTPALGWDDLCGEGVEVHEVPGSHTSLFEGEENIRAVGEKLADCLRRARDARPSGS